MPDDQAISQADFEFSAVGTFHFGQYFFTSFVETILYTMSQGYQPPLRLTFLSSTLIQTPQSELLFD